MFRSSDECAHIIGCTDHVRMPILAAVKIPLNAQPMNPESVSSADHDIVAGRLQIRNIRASLGALTSPTINPKVDGNVLVRLT